MKTKPTRWQMFKLKLSLGKPFNPVHNLGAVEHTVIRFKDKYISIMEGENDAMDFGWSKSPHMFPDVNINDFWTATPPKPIKDNK